jgi:arsenite methyltransferase
MVENETQIHEVVREHYVAAARAAGACCPNTSSCCADATLQLYPADLVAELPVDVSGFSLGCGDPVTIAALQAGETVLDLGSGPGLDCFLAARQVGPTGHVIGVDMTPEMLVTANARKAQLGASNVEFRQGQIEALPVVDSSVDVVMSNCVINLSPDKAAVFGEVFRVLRPGGRVSISDVVTEGEFSPEARADLRRWAECVSGAIDAELYAGMLRQAGFVDVLIVDKVNAEDVVRREPGMPRLFSARIVGRKPA